MSEPRRDPIHGGWVYRKELTRDEATGKRRQVQVRAPTKGGCLAEMREREREVQAGLSRAQRGLTVQAYLAEWLDTVVHVTHEKPNTERIYRSGMRLHVAPYLGDILLGKLRPADCQGWVAALTRAGIAPASIHLYAAALRSALEHAARTERIPRNPMEGARLPPLPRTAKPVWTRAEGRQFLAVARGDSYAPIWQLGLLAGLRIGEAIALRWADVAAERGCLVVRRSYNPGNGRETSTKSGQTRLVYLDPETLAVLAAHRAAQDFRHGRLGYPWSLESYVCAGSAGRRRHPQAVRDHLKVLIAAAGVPVLGFHGLRRTYVTRRISAGHDVALVASQVGHADVGTTRDWYYQIEDDEQRRLARGLRAVVTDEPEPDEDDQEAADLA